MRLGVGLGGDDKLQASCSEVLVGAGGSMLLCSTVPLCLSPHTAMEATNTHPLERAIASCKSTRDSPGWDGGTATSGCSKAVSGGCFGSELETPTSCIAAFPNFETNSVCSPL